MKTNILKLLATFLCFNGIAYADLPNTNELYLPERTGLMGHQTEQANAEWNEQIAKDAIKAGECRPAALDPEGHWGAIACGFQMSIRSSTNIFIAGTNMPVVVILRNTTTNTLSRLTIARGLSDGGEVLLTVEDESGHVRDNMPPGLEGVDFANLAAKRQIKHEYDLNTEFHLPVGSFMVYAEQGVFEQSPSTKRIYGPTKVRSGVLTIKVVPP